MHISSETLIMDQMAMALQKGSPLLQTMNRAKFLCFLFNVFFGDRIGQFVENGLFENWMIEVFHSTPAKVHIGEGRDSPSDLIKNLNLRVLQSIFFICLFGLLFSILVFICEAIHSLGKIGFHLIIFLFKLKFKFRRINRKLVFWNKNISFKYHH